MCQIPYVYKHLRGATAQPEHSPYVKTPPSKPIANTPQSAPRSASRPKLLLICYLYRACVDRERSDLEDRRIFVRTRLVNEIWLEDTLGNGDMEHQHGAVTKDHQEEQSTGHVEPAGRQQCHEHGIHED